MINHDARVARYYLLYLFAQRNLNDFIGLEAMGGIPLSLWIMWITQICAVV